jgi:hypothetical protein
MATIPLFNDGQAPRTPQAAPLSRIPTARLELDYASLANKAAAANQMPELPRDFFRGLQMGDQALGDAVQQLGNSMQELSVRQMQAKEYADAEEIQTELRYRELEFEKWRTENPDPSKWGEEFNRRFQAVQKDFDGRPYLPRTRALAQRSLDRFGQHGLISVEIDAKRKEFARAHDAVRAKRELGIETRNPNLIAEADRDAVGMSLEEPNVAALENLRATKAMQKGMQADLIFNSPKVALDILEGRVEPPDYMADMSAEERFKAARTARLTIAENQQVILQQVEKDIASNVLTSVEQFESQVDQYDIKGTLDAETRRQAHAIIRGRVFDPGLFNEHLLAAKHFDKNGLGEDADEYEWTLRRRFMNHPAHYREQLEKTLDASKARTSGEPSGLKLARNLLHQKHENEQLSDDDGTPLLYKQEKFLMDALTDASKTKVFGITEKQTQELIVLDGPARIQRFRELVQNRTKGGKTFEIADPAAYSNLTPFTKDLFHKALHEGAFVDHNRYKKSAQRETELARQLEKYAQDNPNATEDDFVKWIELNTSRDRRQNGVRALNDPVTPDNPLPLPVPGAGASLDLIGPLRNQLAQ